MKRRFLAVVVAVTVALLGALVLRSTISPDRIRTVVEARLAGWIGAPVKIDGRVEVHLLPHPRVVWRDAALIGAAGAIARADEIDVGLDTVGLLHGRTEPTTVTVERPVARIAVDGLAAPTGRDALFARLAALPALSATLRNGRLTFVGADGREETAEALTADLRWPARPGARGELDVAARWRDAPLTLALVGPTDPAAGASALRLDVTGPGVTLHHKGRLTPATAPWLAGTLVVDVTEPDRLATWLGVDRLRDLLQVPLHAEGRLAADADAVTLTELDLSLGGAHATGALGLGSADGRPLVSGTLAFGTVDLSDPAVPLPLGPGWKALAVDTAAPGLDLRLSATRLKTPHTVFDRVAATVRLVAGRLDADVGEAMLWDRPLSATLSGDLAADGLHATLHADVDDLPATEIGSLFGVDGIEAGTVSVAFDGESTCRRFGDCVSGLTGRLHVAARDLAVTGNSPFGTITRFHPIVVGPKSGPKKAVWPSAVAEIHVSGTDAFVDGIDVVGEAARFSLRGTGDLAVGSVDLAGHALFPNFRADPARSGADTIRLPIRVHGPIGHLEITPGMPEQAPIPSVDPPSVPAPLPFAPTPTQ